MNKAGELQQGRPSLKPGYLPVTAFDKIEHANLTDVGVRRSHNQDAHAVVLANDAAHWQQQGHVFLVADGMGAHAVGELASEMAAKSIPLIYHKHVAEGVELALQRAFQETNARIHERGQQNPEFKNMGTTSTALVLRPEGAWIAHVGDSRVYRVRGGRIEQLSYDHSLVWETARRHGVRPEEIQGVKSNVIIRSMGPEAKVQPDIEGPHPYQDGDRFVVCSDGLSGPLSDQEIGGVTSVLPPAEACQLLIDMANLRGGPDNITVLIAHVPEAGPPEPVRKTRRRSLPWPLLVLVLGVLLAGGSVGLTIAKKPGGVEAFVLAIVAILAGIVGLVFHYRREQKRVTEPPPRPRNKVYRHANCSIDRPFLDQLLKMETTLVQQARERQWQLDWKTQQRHHGLAERCLTKDDLDGAFRETCRAIRPLTEALAEHRNKEEAFRPHWDKAHDAGSQAG